MSEINSSDFKPSAWTVTWQIMLTISITAAVVVGLFMLFGAGKAPIEGTYSGCTLKGKNEAGHKGGISRTIFAEGCNGAASDKVQMLNINTPGTSAEVNEVFESLKIGETYNFKTVSRGDDVSIVEVLSKSN